LLKRIPANANAILLVGRSFTGTWSAINRELL
jgi:hypothetical protein